MNNSTKYRDARPGCRIGFVMEQGLGHITHTQNVQLRVDSDSQIEPEWMLVPHYASDFWEKLPSWSIKMGVRSRRMLRSIRRDRMPDCLFFHTQIFTLFNYDFVKRIPSVISLDATPHQFKGIASSYDSNPATGVLGKIKHEWYRGVFRHAVGLVAISKWVRDSLIADYGVEPDKIMVIPYSVDLEQWKMPDRRNRTDKRIKLLFVGGDFKRKGGELLLEAYRKELSELCELDIVTRDEVLAPETFVRIHRDMKPGSPELRRLFTDADIFVLPTFGDAHSIVGVEAMAAGLPVISTRVGAIPEVVEHGVTGYLLGDNTPAAISSYVLDLVKARNKRLEMGYAGRQRAQDIFSVQENYDRLLVYLKRVASCDLDAEVS